MEKKTDENKMQCDVVFIQATFRLNHLSNAISMKRNWKFAIDLTNDDDDEMMMVVLQSTPMHSHFACIIPTVFIPFSQVTGSNE